MTRGQYLFAFANMCHTGPAAVDDLPMSDFIQLLAGIRQAEQAAQQAERDGRA